MNALHISKALNKLEIDEWVISGNCGNKEEFLAGFKKVIGKTNDGSAILTQDQTKWGFNVDEVLAMAKQIEDEEPLEALREERNKRIAETDWWALSDVAMSPEQTAYRKALRDITDQYSSLEEVVWPVKPT
jgi:hypothetical protein